MQDYTTRAIEAISKHAQELVAADKKAGTTETTEGKKHRDLLAEVELGYKKLTKEIKKIQHQLSELSKTHSLPKDNPVWEETNNAVAEINKHRPHQPITAPKAIIELSQEEMLKLNHNNMVFPAGYIYHKGMFLL